MAGQPTTTEMHLRWSTSVPTNSVRPIAQLFDQQLAINWNTPRDSQPRARRSNDESTHGDASLVVRTGRVKGE